MFIDHKDDRKDKIRRQPLQDYSLSVWDVAGFDRNLPGIFGTRLAKSFGSTGSCFIIGVVEGSLPPKAASERRFEIGHVLFLDIVGYSKLPIDDQSESLRVLNEAVRGTEQFRAAEAEGKL
jgi:hypothetical protein